MAPCALCEGRSLGYLGRRGQVGTASLPCNRRSAHTRVLHGRDAVPTALPLTVGFVLCFAPPFGQARNGAAPVGLCHQKSIDAAR